MTFSKVCSSFLGKKSALVNLVQSRRMTLEQLHGLYSDRGDYVYADFFQLEKTASILAVSLSHVLREFGADIADLQDKVKVCRNADQFERLKMIGCQAAYHYRHVMKTTADKNLMVLRTSPMFDSVNQGQLNSGHSAKELVYVLSDTVGVRWKSEAGVQRQNILSAGDSIYVDSWVPHSFYSLAPDSQILAIDYA